MLFRSIATSLYFSLVGLAKIEAQTSLPPSLPPLQAHPLPPALAQWQDSPPVGDYFDQIQSSPAGYLIWSEFPIKVYWERPAELATANASDRRLQQWSGAVGQAVAEWQVYLPLVAVSRRELADIIIERSPPPLGSRLDPKTGKLQIPRARTAETRYQFYVREGNPLVLYHRMTVNLSPGLSEASTLAAVRHELGHALGIWGHSPLETDALYFSQVRQPTTISRRDINTLKKIYQQPTRLGWALPL